MWKESVQLRRSIMLSAVLLTVCLFGMACIIHTEEPLAEEIPTVQPTAPAIENLGGDGWELDLATKTLTIHNNVGMANWLAYRNSFSAEGAKQEWETVVVPNVEHLIIKEGVRNILPYAFRPMEKLKTVEFPEGITRIGDYAFAGCTSIEEITLPSTVEEIGEASFEDCANLKAIGFSEGITTIGDFAFFGCTSLEDVILPDSLVKLGYGAFLDCNGMKSIVLSSNLTILRECLLSGCSQLEDVVIPANVTLIEEYALETSYGEDIGYPGLFGAKRIIFEGTVDEIESFTYYFLIGNLKQIVFLAGKPVCLAPHPPSWREDYKDIRDAAGFVEYGGEVTEGIVIYYLNEYRDEWAPNGETVWLGCPLVGIDSLDDLPPLE